ncbi:MAG: hypothetical protein K6F99_07895 [Lachnospiraceae bacterium]|nr:hypothetical protein [Lachnospiraceae bacterium]
MLLSEELFEKVKAKWDLSCSKPFVVEMAKGTLPVIKFRNYMLQDYLYLSDYIGILKGACEEAEEAGIRAFIEDTLTQTENETRDVHLPNMKGLGVTDTDIRESVISPVLKEYGAYMRSQLNGKMIIYVLTALLQCSWGYAYIGESVSKKYKDEIALSDYKSWFDSYCSREYTLANKRWIDIVDRMAYGIDKGTKAELTQIFLNCADYENRFWDTLYAYSGA